MGREVKVKREWRGSNLKCTSESEGRDQEEMCLGAKKLEVSSGTGEAAATRGKEVARIGDSTLGNLL